MFTINCHHSCRWLFVLRMQTGLKFKRNVWCCWRAFNIDTVKTLCIGWQLIHHSSCLHKVGVMTGRKWAFCLSVRRSPSFCGSDQFSTRLVYRVEGEECWDTVRKAVFVDCLIAEQLKIAVSSSMHQNVIYSDTM